MVIVLSENVGKIHASPEALRTFFYRCNTDTQFRAGFLNNPIATLIENQIQVDDQAANEIIQSLQTLKSRFGKEIYLVPIGFEDHRWKLMKNGWGLVIEGSENARTSDPLVIP